MNLCNRFDTYETTIDGCLSMGGGHGMYGFLYMEKCGFFVRNSRKIHCMHKKTWENAHRKRSYFHQYGKKRRICRIFFMSIFSVPLPSAQNRLENTVFWEKWSLGILIFSFGIGKLTGV